MVFIDLDSTQNTFWWSPGVCYNETPLYHDPLLALSHIYTSMYADVTREGVCVHVHCPGSVIPNQLSFAVTTLRNSIMWKTNVSQSARCWFLLETNIFLRNQHLSRCWFPTATNILQIERCWFPTPFVVAVICLHLYRDSQGVLPPEMCQQMESLLPLGHTTKLATM